MARSPTEGAAGFEVWQGVTFLLGDSTPSATLELVRSHLLKAKGAVEASRRFSTVLNITPRPWCE